jgi:hypothetical protein
MFKLLSFSLLAASASAARGKDGLPRVNKYALPRENDRPNVAASDEKKEVMVMINAMKKGLEKSSSFEDVASVLNEARGACSVIKGPALTPRTCRRLARSANTAGVGKRTPSLSKYALLVEKSKENTDRALGIRAMSRHRLGSPTKKRRGSLSKSRDSSSAPVLPSRTKPNGVGSSAADDRKSRIARVRKAQQRRSLRALSRNKSSIDLRPPYAVYSTLDGSCPTMLHSDLPKDGRC